MGSVRLREAAQRDLVQHVVYLAESAGMPTADRFLQAAESTFAELSRQPLLGAPIPLNHTDLVRMRKWRIKGFDNHLVFYQPRTDGVSIVRVLHAASDWWALLGLEPS